MRFLKSFLNNFRRFYAFVHPFNFDFCDIECNFTFQIFTLAFRLILTCVLLYQKHFKNDYYSFSKTKARTNSNIYIINLICVLKQINHIIEEIKSHFYTFKLENASIIIINIITLIIFDQIISSFSSSYCKLFIIFVSFIS